MSNGGSMRGLAQAAQDILLSERRKLTAAEIQEAQKVFADTIDYGDVLIADKLGYDGRPFTFYAGAFGATAIAFGNHYILFMGPDVFKSMPTEQWPTFIHEMTHVWQGQNHFIHAGYMLNSLISQTIKGDAAYEYELGDFWTSYNPEQQARIVEQWYDLENMSRSGPRYHYIRDFILHPRRSRLIEAGLLLNGAAPEGML